MYNKDQAKRIEEKVLESKKPILVEDLVNYIGGYRRLKYYYPNELAREEHINKLKLDLYLYDKDEKPYETLYNNLFDDNSVIKVLVGVYYQEMNPFLEE